MLFLFLSFSFFSKSESGWAGGEGIRSKEPEKSEKTAMGASVRGPVSNFRSSISSPNQAMHVSLSETLQLGYLGVVLLASGDCVDLLRLHHVLGSLHFKKTKPEISWFVRCPWAFCVFVRVHAQRVTQAELVSISVRVQHPRWSDPLFTKSSRRLPQQLSSLPLQLLSLDSFLGCFCTCHCPI